MNTTCPKCSGNMEPVVVADIEVDRCTHCGGMWFDFMEQVHLRDAHLQELIDTGDAEQGRKLNEKTRINCPRCTSPLTHQRDVERREVQYEYCSICNGVFFDAGEFKKYSEEGFFERLRSKFRSQPHR